MRKAPVVISSDRRIPELEPFKLTEHLYVVHATPGPVGPNGQVVGVQGFGALADRPVSNSSDLEHFLRSTPRHQLIDSWSQQVRGAVTVSLFEPISKTILMMPDPLGGSIVFYYDKDGVRAASASLPDLVQVLKSFGVKMKKSLKFSIELVISTNGGLNESSYEEIRSLDIMEYISIDREKIETLPYRNIDLSASSARDYDDMIDRAAQDIRNTIAAATRQSVTSRICHLTGGFDSRLVAAATIDTGVSDSYRYFCQGDSVLPDKKLAEQVAAELGLTMTNYSGVSTRQSPSDFGGGLAGPMIHSSGLLAVGPHSGNSFSDTVILSGGYGGTFRSTYDYRFLDRETESVAGSDLGRSLWGDYLFAGGENSLISRDYSDYLSGKIEYKMDQGRSLGIREDALGDMFYIQTRARYFISHISSAWNKYVRRIDPLYSLSAIHGALSLPLKERSANGIGFDLAMRLDPRILEYPFDSQKFDLSAIGRQPTTTPKQFSGKPTAYDAVVNDPFQQVDFGYLKLPKATSEDVATAKRMNARAYQVSGRTVAREALNELLASIPRSELSEFINMKELDVLRKRPANTRVRMRTLFNLYSSLSWYLTDDDSGKDESVLR